MTTAVAFRGVMVAQLYRMVELMNPGKIVDVTILVEAEEDNWEEIMLFCLLTAIWQIFQCSVLTICTRPINPSTLTP